MTNPYSAIVAAMDDEQLTVLLAKAIGLKGRWNSATKSFHDDDNSWGDDPFVPLEYFDQTFTVILETPGATLVDGNIIHIILDGVTVLQVAIDGIMPLANTYISTREMRFICEVAAIHYLTANGGVDA